MAKDNSNKTNAAVEPQTPLEVELKSLESMIRAFETLDEKARLRIMAYFVSRYQQYVP